ncbi:hypothetical protein CLU81_0130 [Flavobacterium sp. 9]|uniref:hypothetical protein n=1 Tax=Flavobacterium sp. 9 TaxID=2035198 RepID=UPI000C17987A|nr:hypothetical protein [Flavobacterium sp. 9]PIF29746.1 hypothetical protein CLU81_0130 [Flavobacterium sp. 9]
MTNIYPKEYFKTLNNKVERATCFIMMPFDPKFDDVNNTITNTLQSTNLNFVCKRADDIIEPHIVETILKGILRAEYIIADLTDRNPNVFYELGIAHCIKDIDKVIILSQNMETIPFDLRQFRCITYKQTEEGLIQLRDDLIKTFEAVAKHRFVLKVTEGKELLFDKKLAGNDTNFYQLEFKVPHIGYGAIKLFINFNQIRIDRDPYIIESQFLFLTNEKATEKIQNIPWSVSLLNIDEQNKQAVISIEID